MRAKLEILISCKREALKHPIPYRFTNPDIMSYGESNIHQMILHGRFVDKTASYVNALDPSSDYPVGVRMGCFVRRMGKSTWLQFLLECVGVRKALETRRRNYSQFFKYVAGTIKGEHFVRSPLRPTIFLDLVDCDSTNTLEQIITLQLKDGGLFVEGSTDVRTLFRLGIPLLSQLYSEASQGLDGEWVDDRPLILIDEYDAPMRNGMVCRVAEEETKDPSEEEDMRVAKEGYRRLHAEIRKLCRIFKGQLKNELYGIVMVSLLRIGGTGLSEVNVTEDLNMYAQHHELFGITEKDLKHILDTAQKDLDGKTVCWNPAQSDPPLTWDKALSWARDLDVVKVTDKTEEEKKRKFLAYLEDEINGFCTAFLGRTEEKLTPLYSPIDALVVMRNIAEGNVVAPKREWLQSAKDAFTETIRISGNFYQAVEALTGTRVSMDQISSIQDISTYLENESNMKILFYNLGLLYVKKVTDDDYVVLSPVLEGSDTKNNDIISVLTKAHRGEPPVLTDKRVTEYF